MLANFARDPDGGLTPLVQHQSPGGPFEANWLPAPAAPFSLIRRLYQPKPEALTGHWSPPKAERLPPHTP